MIIKNNISKFFCCQNGIAAITYALVFPALMSFCALAFDGAYIYMKRNKLVNVLNEAGLAISANKVTDNQTADGVRDEGMLRQYLSYHFPNDKIVIARVVRKDSTNKILFDIEAEMSFATLLPLWGMYPSFSEKVNFDGVGKVKKSRGIGGMADYAFVVDFSASMGWATGSGGTRIQVLKQVVNEVTKEAINNSSKATFAIIPYDNGVSVKLPNDNKNPLGGDNIGCSVVMVPDATSSYNIDFAFWADKSREPLENGTYTDPNIAKLMAATPPEGYSNEFLRIDYGRYLYFQFAITQARNSSKNYWATFVNNGQGSNIDKTVNGVCIDNKKNPLSIYAGMPKLQNIIPYSCDLGLPDEALKNDNTLHPLLKVTNSFYQPHNVEKIKREFADFDFSINDHQGGYKNNNTISNITAIDIDKTLNGMFNPNNIITMAFTPMMPKMYSHPFTNMCDSPRDNYSTTNFITYKQPTYMIELTNDLNKLAEFNNMQPRGGTDSSSGLLRAVPVLAKGKNPRKVMIIISDGDDNAGILPVRDALHAVKKDLTTNKIASIGICDRIRADMPKYSENTVKTEIYFINVVDENADDRARTQYWATNCTGQDKAILATNTKALKDTLIEIMSDDGGETGTFYLDEDEK